MNMETPALMRSEEDILRSAPFSPLLRSPKTPSAKQLEKTLSIVTLEIEGLISPRKKRGRQAQASFDSTLSAFLADLVAASAPNFSDGWCYRPLVSTAFMNTLASKRQFDAIVRCWTHSEMIEMKKGFRIREDFDGEATNTGQRWATRYRATPKLLELAASFGVMHGTVGDHYNIEHKRSFPIELRGKKVRRDGKKKGQPTSFIRTDPSVVKLADEVREINVFLQKHDFSCEPACKIDPCIGVIGVQK
jgi:hypothetical protein